MPELQTHQGACHCGAVRYTAETDLAQVIQCNCSICSKHGLLISFVPEDKFTLLSGDGNLKDTSSTRIRSITSSARPVAPSRSLAARALTARGWSPSMCVAWTT